MKYTQSDLEAFGMRELIEKVLELQDEQVENIRIGLTEEDLTDLINDNTFDWNFKGIEVHLYNESLNPSSN